MFGAFFEQRRIRLGFNLATRIKDESRNRILRSCRKCWCKTKPCAGNAV